jgi:uncharacterized protein YdaU (DUF1376 family)
MFYRTLLQAAFSTASTRPDLPNNDAQLCRLLGGVPAEVWAQHKDEVLSMFTQVGDVLMHRRLREDFGKLQDYRHSQSESKSKYWDKVRAERLQASKKLATTAVLPRLYQEDVDVDSDIETENDRDDEVQNPPVRSSSKPLSITPSENLTIYKCSELWSFHRGGSLDMTDSHLVLPLIEDYGPDQVIDVFAWFCQHDEHCANIHDQPKPEETFSNFCRRFEHMHTLMIEEIAAEESAA